MANLKKIEKKVFQETMDSHNLWLVDKKAGKKAKFVGVSLKGYSFEGMDLTGMSFSQVDLTNVSFEGANLTNVLFEQADLKEANFNQAILTSTAFIHADLKDTKFQQATLNQTQWVHSDLTNNDFYFSKGEGWKLTDCHLINVQGVGSEWKKLVITRCEVTGVLSGMKMESVEAKHSQFTDIQWEEATLTSAVWDNCTFQNVIFEKSTLHSMEWVRSQLKKVDFAEAKISQSKWEDCITEDLGFAYSTLQDMSIRKTTLKNSELSNVKGANVNFMDSNLFTFNLKNSELKKIQFFDSKMNHFNLTDSQLPGFKLENCVIKYISSIKNVDLTDFSIRSSSLNALHVSDSRLKTGSFNRSDLSFTIWKGVTSENVDWSNCHFNDSTINESSFSDGDWKACQFQKSVLSELELFKMKLNDSNFTQATLTNVLFAETDITNVGTDDLQEMTVYSLKLYPNLKTLKYWKDLNLFTYGNLQGHKEEITTKINNQLSDEATKKALFHMIELIENTPSFA